MTRSQQELQILQKFRIYAVFVNFVEFNPGHISTELQMITKYLTLFRPGGRADSARGDFGR